MFTITADELPLFMACNGSRLLPPFELPGEVSSVTRDEGNAAHWLAKVVFSEQHTIEELTDRKAPNGIFITHEIAEHVREYVQMLRDMRVDPSDFSDMEVETSFGNDQWRVNSRADHIFYSTVLAYDPTTNVVNNEPNVLVINDFKYGWRIVEPQDNWTLIAHAIGFCLVRALTPSRIDLVIHQPRPHHRDGHVRVFSLTYEQLCAKYAELAAALSSPSETLRTGSHCGICKANNNCAAADVGMYNAVDVVMQTAISGNISDAALAQELDLLKRAQSMLNDRIAAREELAIHRIKSGGVVANYFLERELTNRQWKDGITLETLQAVTGKNLAAPSKIVTPKQAERLGVLPDIVNMFAERRPKGLKLVRQDAQKKAERMFGK